MDFQLAVFQIAVLLFSVVIHEVSHGVIANHLGDPTAKNLGRLTLNPVKHIDFFGSILLPALLVLSHAPIIFGWAKPVPYNPMFLRDPKRGAAYIAIAGPLANFSVAIILGIVLRVVSPPEAFAFALQIIIYINILLGVFNLVPIPPLDGSKLLFAFLGERHVAIERFLEQYGMFMLLIFIFFGFQFLMPIIRVLFRLVTGASF
ncbi:MAG: site-2 protease family protein [Candidatus Azambacteria bacterium]|nr:site-2 protease family protein [Candidatus Azambacteria bacterium]